jgi:hypothetical protein
MAAPPQQKPDSSQCSKQQGGWLGDGDVGEFSNGSVHDKYTLGLGLAVVFKGRRSSLSYARLYVAAFTVKPSRDE